MLTSLSAAIAPSLIRQMITLDPCCPIGVVFVILASVVGRAKQVISERRLSGPFAFLFSADSNVKRESLID